MSEMDRMLGSSKTYAKVTRQLADRYGVEWNDFNPSRWNAHLQGLVETIVRAECRRAVDEARFRFLRLAGQHTKNPLVIPGCTVKFDAGGVGRYSFPGFDARAKSSVTSTRKTKMTNSTGPTPLRAPTRIEIDQEVRSMERSAKRADEKAKLDALWENVRR